MRAANFLEIHRKNQRKYQISLAIALFVEITIILLLLLTTYHHLSARINHVQHQIKEKIRKQKQSLAHKTKKKSETLLSNFLLLMESIEKILPANAKVSQITRDKNGIELIVNFPNFLMALHFAQSIQQQQHFYKTTRLTSLKNGKISIQLKAKNHHE